MPNHQEAEAPKVMVEEGMVIIDHANCVITMQPNEAVNLAERLMDAGAQELGRVATERLYRGDR